MAKTAIQISEDVAAGATVNVLSQKRFENVARTGMITLAHTGAAAGLEAEFFVADRNALERSPVGGANRVPQIPEDVAVDDVDAFQGEKLQLNVTNTSGGALVYQAKLILDDNVAFIQ